MKIKTIHHIGLVVESVDQARWFYGEFLGMEELPRPENFHFDGAWFKAGDAHIHMITGKDTTARTGIEEPGQGKQDGMATHWAFEVEDIDAYVEKAREMGVKIVGGPMERGLGATQLYMQDPDGYIVEIFEMTYRDAPPKIKPSYGSGA